MYWKINIAMMTIIQNCIYIFNTIPIKIPAGSFVEIDKLLLKFFMEMPEWPKQL